MAINTGIFPNKALEMQHNPVKKMKTHDDYVAMLEQYKDTPYYDYLVNNNPWDWSRQVEFSPNLLQSIGEELGDYSARNQYYQGIQQQQNQWVSDYVEAMRQQEYNEPVNQVKREAAAGINPNLSPSLINPGSAAENDQPSQLVGQSQDSAVASLASAGMSVLSTAVGFIHQFQSIKSTSLDNELRSLSFNKGLQDTAMDLIKGGTSEFLANEAAFDASDWPQSLSLVESINKYFDRRIDKLPYSGKVKKRLHHIINDSIFSTRYNNDGSAVTGYTAGYEKMVNDLIADLRSSRNNLAQKSSLPGSESSSQNALRFYTDNIYKPIQDLILQVEKGRLSFDKSYFDNANQIGLGASKSVAESAGYQLKTDVLSIKKNITSTFAKINYKLRNDKKVTPTWKIALEAGLSSAEALILSRLAIN